MRKMKAKKGVAAILTATAIMAAAMPVSAAGDEQTMDLSMSKAATYTMTIPSTTNEIAFGTVDTLIGDLSVKGDVGTKQQVTVAVAKTDFVDEKDDTNKFAFQLQNGNKDFTGAIWSTDELRAAAATAYPLTVHIPSTTWGSTKAGSYKATLTFTAELQDIPEVTP